jgi:hypothetical protein
MNWKPCVLKYIPFLAILATGLCHAQIVPPVPKGNGYIDLGRLVGPPRDRIIAVDLTVKQDGTVGDIEVVTGFYDEEYRFKALRALRGIRFQPARRDGVPVDFYGWRLVLTTRKSFTTATHPGFQSEYEKVSGLTQSGDFAGAESAIQELIKNRIMTVFEYAFLNEALVPLYVKLNRPYDALRASRLATLRSGHMEAEFQTGSRIRANDPSWPYFLTKEMLATALRQRFTLALALERFGEANATYNELRAIEDLAEDDPITLRSRDLENRRRSPEPLAVRGKFDHGEWEFSPTRRSLYAKVGAGASVRSVDVKCSLHKETVAFEIDRDILLPPAWGRCTLTFHGDDGADIVVTEKALSATRL